MSDIAAVSELLNGEIARGRLKDAALHIEQDGVVIHDAVYGDARTDSIWKIYSMTKPITSVAARICIDRGLFTPLEDAGDFIPALKHPLAVQPHGSVRRAEKPVTIQNLLDMTSGLPYPGDGSVSQEFMQHQRELLNARIAGGRTLSTLEVCNELAKTPLEFEPGTGFRYGVGADIIGGIIEVTTGMRYDLFLQQEIFDPLGMTDTSFFLTQEQLARLAPMYSRHQREQRLVPATESELAWLSLSDPTAEPQFLSGGGGLFSTMADYVRFTRFLLSDRKHHPASSLSPSALHQFQTELRPGYGYHDFFRVLQDPSVAGLSGPVGEFGWDGLPGHYVHVDPVRNLIMVYMQHIAQGADMDLRYRMYNTVYANLP
ncbi:MAG: beta-lactamase family protein [Treponemataceae bacterium]|nr:beta-lactamase family protein [Treponemataceae bacterium]